jgi:hypothetical protein
MMKNWREESALLHNTSTMQSGLSFRGARRSMQPSQGGSKRPHLTIKRNPNANDASTIQNEKKKSLLKTTQNEKKFKTERVDSALNTRKSALVLECFSQHLAIDLHGAIIASKSSFSGVGTLVSENSLALLLQLLIQRQCAVVLCQNTKAIPVCRVNGVHHRIRHTHGLKSQESGPWPHLLAARTPSNTRHTSHVTRRTSNVTPHTSSNNPLPPQRTRSAFIWDTAARGGASFKTEAAQVCNNVEFVVGLSATSFRSADAAQVCSNVGFVADDGVVECSLAAAARQIVSERW